MNPETGPQVAVVTGASAGIGKSTARMLAEKGWRVICTGRDPGRSTAAEAELRAAVPGAAITFLRGDFCEMRDVLRIAREIKELTPRLDVLINNAGGVRDKLYITSEKLEATFAANHLAPFLLTRELLPLLKTTAAITPSGTVRVIAVSSYGHKRCKDIHWQDLNMFDAFTTSAAYCQAKLGNILFTRELARRVSSDGIIAQSMHPGTVMSNFASHADAGIQSFMEANATDAPDKPARTLVWLATAPETGRDPGRYFYDMEEEEPTELAKNDAVAHRFWLESETILDRVLGQQSASLSR